MVAKHFNRCVHPMEIIMIYGLIPKMANQMIVADDGGAQVSFDGGDNWSSMMNQPTAQIYRVTTDNAFPYRILGAQQDNSTIRIRSRTQGAGITESDWQSTAGAEVVT